MHSLVNSIFTKQYSMTLRTCLERIISSEESSIIGEDLACLHPTKNSLSYNSGEG